MITPELLQAAAYLSRVAEPAAAALFELVDRVGYLEAAAAVRSGAVDDSVAAVTEARRTSADAVADLEAAERNGIRLLMPGSPDWPDFALGALNAAGRARLAGWRAGRRARPDRGELLPPLALWVKGSASLAESTVRSVAVVGSRAATAYGEHVAADLSYGVALRDVTVVSGGAYGIDAAAHRGCLAADGVCVLVSAGGLDRPYPTGNSSLFERVAATGLLVSERPPGSAPHRQRFLSRNRLIAALASATLVVEAAPRSGALNSARYARDLGRPVLAVPGPITSAMSAGCHALIRRDDRPAELVSSAAELLPFCAGLDADTVAVPVLPFVEVLDQLDEVARSVLDGFPARGPVTTDELAGLSGRPRSDVLDALPLLETYGLVRADGAAYRRVTGEPTAP